MGPRSDGVLWAPTKSTHVCWRRQSSDDHVSIQGGRHSWTHETFHWSHQLLNRQCQERDHKAGVPAHRGTACGWINKAIWAQGNEKVSTANVGNSAAWHCGKEGPECMVLLGTRQASDEEAPSDVRKRHQRGLRRIQNVKFVDEFWGS